ncbi:MAG: hypothetical protein ABJB39_11270, partial [Chloroflexota bacterium]
ATATVAVLPADTAQTVTVDGNRPVKDDGDQHRRFCLRLNELLTRLVEKGVITREQKERILDAFNCLPRSTDRPASTDRPTTTRPTAAN